MSSASTWLLSRHQVLGPTRCLDDAQAALPWEGKGGRCNVLQPGAACDLVPKSKDGTEHGCWHDCVELGTTARAGREPEKPLKELVAMTAQGSAPKNGAIQLIPHPSGALCWYPSRDVISSLGWGSPA